MSIVEIFVLHYLIQNINKMKHYFPEKIIKDIKQTLFLKRAIKVKNTNT